MHRTYPEQYTLKILDSVHKLNGHVTTPLFEHLGASSWHKGDAKLILHLGAIVETAKHQSFLFTFLVFGGVIFCLTAVIFWSRQKRQGQGRELDLESSKLAHQ